MRKSLSLKKLSAVCFMLFFTLGFNSSFGQPGANTTTNCVPPGGTAGVPNDPAYIGSFHATYPNGGNVYDLTQPQHSMFTNCDTPPTTTGSTTIHSFGSTVKGQMSVNGGQAMNMQAPAQVTVKMTKTGGADSQTGTFDTEMLQLDISGGTLPVGVMIRESPTLQSTGQTSISHMGTGFHIDSFFDIFTELSTDGGGTWTPSSAGAGHMVLTTPTTPVIPTLNQWGLIIFSLLMLSVVMVYVRKRRIA